MRYGGWLGPHDHPHAPPAGRGRDLGPAAYRPAGADKTDRARGVRANTPLSSRAQRAGAGDCGDEGQPLYQGRRRPAAPRARASLAQPPSRAPLPHLEKAMGSKRDSGYSRGERGWELKTGLSDLGDPNDGRD